MNSEKNKVSNVEKRLVEMKEEKNEFVVVIPFPRARKKNPQFSIPENLPEIFGC